MKSGYYIFPCGYMSSTLEYSGVLKKIDMQCAEFSKHYNIKYIQAFEIKHDYKLYKLTRRLLWNSADRQYDEILLQMVSPDFVYIRRTTADKKLIKFLKAIKDNNPECKIIMEFYTYPYEKDEYKSLPGKLSLFKDRFFRVKYEDVIDRIVTYTNDEYIYNVKTIPTINGVDTNQFRAIIPRKTDDEIHMLAVAMFQKHHGYERIIEGLYQYYSNGGQRILKLYLVGDGPEIDLYKALVDKYCLSDNVIFCGKKTGKDLDEAYNNADIGLGSFGFYKIGLESASSLKTKEYFSKGLPVAAGCLETFVKGEGSKYYLSFPNDKTPIDINRIISFFDSVYSTNNGSRQIVVNSIHQFAEDNVSMKIVLNPIIDYINS